MLRLNPHRNAPRRHVPFINAIRYSLGFGVVRCKFDALYIVTQALDKHSERDLKKNREALLMISVFKT